MRPEFRRPFRPSFSCSFRLLAPLVLALHFVNCQSNTFELNIRMRSPQDHPVVYRGSRVIAQFGNHPPEAPQPLTEDGQAVFPNLDRSKMRDTVRLSYLAENGRPYQIIQQMFYTAADAGERPIDFVVEIVPDTTHIQFSLKDKNGLIAHALVHIDNKIIIETDDYGLVDVYVPKTAGSTAHFKVEKDGKILMDKDLVLSVEYQRVYVDQ